MTCLCLERSERNDKKYEYVRQRWGYRHIGLVCGANIIYPSYSAERRMYGIYPKGTAGFSVIPNLYVITITNYDLFGEDYMMYMVRNRCEEIPEMEYDDGLQFIYFNTKGQKGGSQAIKNMLRYIQNSDSKNAVDDATRMIDFYVKKVKNLPEVEAGYMTLGDWIDNIVEDAKKDMAEEVRKEVTEQVTEQSIKTVVEIFQEYHDTKENAAVKLRSKFPEYANQAEELVEKYWKEN